MSNHDDNRSGTGDGWDTQRAWRVAVKLAETHQKLQSLYGYVLRNSEDGGRRRLDRLASKMTLFTPLIDAKNVLYQLEIIMT
jgi:hypothetical protein